MSKKNNIHTYLYVLLYPLLFLLSKLVWLILSVRHFLYDKNILHSKHFSEVITICIGNLNFGGSGKTPLTNYLINLLKPSYKIAVLSRGYGRKTKGFRIVQTNDDYFHCGDEPLMYKYKHPDILVAVCENRAEGIQKILQHSPDVQIILLDDAFQHRRLKADINILVTEYTKPFFKDNLFPLGKLRDLKHRAFHSDMLIVSKTPENTADSEREIFLSQAKTYYSKDIFFSKIEYADFYEMHSSQTLVPHKDLSKYNCILITGIANPAPLANFIKEYANHFYHLNYPDHYVFTQKDFELIKNMFLEWQKHYPPVILVTTEKDAVRLKNISTAHFNLPIFIAPIQLHFFETNNFENKILNYVRTNSTNRQLHS